MAQEAQESGYRVGIGDEETRDLFDRQGPPERMSAIPRIGYDPGQRPSAAFSPRPSPASVLITVLILALLAVPITDRAGAHRALSPLAGRILSS